MGIATQIPAPINVHNERGGGAGEQGCRGAGERRGRGAEGRGSRGAGEQRTKKPGFCAPREDRETGFLAWILESLAICRKETRFLPGFCAPTKLSARTEKPGFLLGS